MKQVRLTIAGNEIEISDVDKLRLSVTRSIDEIQDIEKSNASRTKTIVVPGTKKNDIALGFGQDINSVTALSQNIKPDALLEVGSTIIIEGFARATKRKIINKDATHEYHLILIGDNGEWKHAINGLNVNDLDYSEFDHTYNKTDIDASELTDSSGVALTKPEIVYPLINYGTTLDMPHPVSTNLDLHTVRVKNRFPAIQKRSILNKILNNAGFKIISTFVDSAFFGNQYMPFVNDALLHPESYRTAKLFKAGLTADVPFVGILPQLDDESTGGNFDNGSNYTPASSTYTIDEDSIQNFTFISEAVYTAGSGQPAQILAIIQLRVTEPDGTVIFYESEAVSFASGVANKAIVETGFVEWTTGTTIKAETLSILSGSSTVKKTGTFFFNEVKREILEGHTVEMNGNLPDIEQIDFIRGLRDEFNLMIFTDITNRQVFIEPHDDFYSTKSIDWTDKLDKSKDETIEDLNDKLAKNVKYAFKRDSKDKVVESILLQTGEEVASLNVANSNKFVDGEQIVGNSLFAPTLMDTWAYVGLLSAKVPRLNKDAVEFPSASGQATDFVFRSLYYDGVQSLPSGESWFFDGVERTDYPRFFSVDEENDNDNSLFWNNTKRSDGLFQKYHRNRFEIRDKGKLYTAFFNLNDSDISKLDFRIPIFVVDTYYLLNKVENYDPLADVTTKAELITALNMNIKAIVDELDESVFPPLPPTGVIPVSTAIDATNPGSPNIFKPTSPTLINSNGFGVQTLGQGSESNLSGVTSYGSQMTMGKANQVGFGNNNEKDDNAQLVIGAGTRTVSKTVFKIDENGTAKFGNGSGVRTTINQVSTEVIYTDSNGEEQVVLMTDASQLVDESIAQPSDG